VVAWLPLPLCWLVGDWWLVALAMETGIATGQWLNSGTRGKGSAMQGGPFFQASTRCDWRLTAVRDGDWPSIVTNWNWYVAMPLFGGKFHHCRSVLPSSSCRYSRSARPKAQPTVDSPLGFYRAAPALLLDPVQTIYGEGSEGQHRHAPSGRSKKAIKQVETCHD
jgi:hypothetical protein